VARKNRKGEKRKEQWFATANIRRGWGWLAGVAERGYPESNRDHKFRKLVLYPFEL
jgi:hypothetical protein